MAKECFSNFGGGRKQYGQHEVVIHGSLQLASTSKEQNTTLPTSRVFLSLA